MCRSPVGGTEGAGDAFTEGTRSPGRVRQHQQRPLLACRRRGSWGCTQDQLPLTPTRQPPTLRPPPRPDNACGPAAPLRTRPGLPRPPASLGPLLPIEPPPSGSLRLLLPSPFQHQAERRVAGDPAPSSPGPGAAGTEDAAAPPRTPLPTSCSPSWRPGLRVRAPGPGLAPRVRPARRRREGGRR